MKHILDTTRLSLREMTIDDLDFVAKMLANEEVMRFYPRRFTREEASGWIDRQRQRYERDGHGLWLVSERATGEPVGQVGLVLRTGEGVVEREVGYLIDRPYWRRGFATEAAAATRDWAFDTLGLTRVISLIRPANLASQGVARKIGMKPERRTDFGGVEHIVFAIERSRDHPRFRKPVE